MSLDSDYDYEVVGWEDFDGNRYEGEPDDLTEAWSMLVYVPGDPNVGRGGEHFWAPTIEPFDNWEDWQDYIEGLIDMYGQA